MLGTFHHHKCPCLHNLWIIDATDWYVSFGMIVLPINSVINPLLYDKTILEFICRKVREFRATIASLMPPNETLTLEGMEMEPLEQPANPGGLAQIQGGVNTDNEISNPYTTGLEMTSDNIIRETET